MGGRDILQPTRHSQPFHKQADDKWQFHIIPYNTEKLPKYVTWLALNNTFFKKNEFYCSNEVIWNNIIYTVKNGLFSETFIISFDTHLWNGAMSQSAELYN